MKKFLSLIFLICLAFGASAQHLITVTKTKNYDEYGSQISVTTATVRVSSDNISSVEASGTGSKIWLKAPQKVDGATITGFSVTSTPDQINTAFNASVATLALSAGSVSAPSGAWGDEPASGWYRIAANNYGFAVNGTKVFEFAAGGATMQGNTTMAKPTIRNNTSTTYTADATVTAAQLAGGLLTTASGGTTGITLTLPTAAQIASQITATIGTVFEFYVLNNGTSGTATVAVGSGIVASGFPGTNTLTLANSATVGIAGFRLTFLSASAATLTRIN